MKKIFLLFFLVTSTLIFAQNVSEDQYVTNEQMAEFPDGGIPHFRQLIAENFRPRKVKGKGVETCQLRFVIDRDGTITNVKAEGTNESFNKEAMLAISKIKTKWIPAKIEGITVRYMMRVPLTMDFN